MIKQFLILSFMLFSLIMQYKITSSISRSEQLIQQIHQRAEELKWM